jgi:hypothetical protein
VRPFTGKHAALAVIAATAVSTGAAAALRTARSAVEAGDGRARAGDVRVGIAAPRAAAAQGCSEYDGFFDLSNDPAKRHSFAFTRAAYSGGGLGRGFGRRSGRSGWATDAPKADWQFLVVFRRLLGIDSYPCQHYVALDDPAIRHFPFLYALEVGSMNLSDEEVKNLREYLLAGGFLMIDDFWGDDEWAAFQYNIERVLPEYEIVELPLEHSIFKTFYEIKEILQVPNVGNARGGWTTSECGPCQPYALGILDDQGRVMVIINWNTDIGDAWEWAEQPYYPLKYSTFAYQMGVNFIVYSMSH